MSFYDETLRARREDDMDDEYGEVGGYGGGSTEEDYEEEEEESIGAEGGGEAGESMGREPSAPTSAPAPKRGGQVLGTLGQGGGVEHGPAVDEGPAAGGEELVERGLARRAVGVQPGRHQSGRHRTPIRTAGRSSRVTRWPEWHGNITLANA